MLYRVLYAAGWLLNHLVCRLHVSGREHVPKAGPLLVVANHLSWYDPIIFGLALPRRAWFFTKVEIFGWPVIGKLCRWTGQIPVRRGEGDRASLEQALAYLREGKMLVMFPEGTVERQEKMIAAQTGVAMLALRSGAPVLPVAHTGTRRVLRTWRSWFPRVTVQIGQPYLPALPAGIPRKSGLQQVTNDMMFRIAGMLPPEGRGVYAGTLTTT